MRRSRRRCGRLATRCVWVRSDRTVPSRLTSTLFALIFALSLALLVWWAVFALDATFGMEHAAQRLAIADVEGAAQALGAASVADLERLALSRRWMFGSEGVFFALVLLTSGWLYVVAVRREREARLAQDRFLAAATHELKTPLATLVLLLDSLRAGRVPEHKVERYLANGLRETERLRLGLDNVLTAAGLRAAHHAGKQTPGDLVDDLRLAIAALDGHATAADVQVTAELPTTLPIVRDPVALQLVLRNLLDNAIKYSPAGGRVEVRARRDGAFAEVAVADTGRGMDQDELAHAFLPFWRGSDTASGGTGLGLHLVRELLREHGGSVHAHSAGRDRGATLTVRLPLHEPNPEESS